MKLTEIARKVLEAYFNGDEFELARQEKNKFKEKKASFVTLTKEGNLRGCIGSLYPRQALWKDVQENAMNAAFHDPRFLPLNHKELSQIKIEISVLSEPKKINSKNPEDLIKKLTKNMGIILNHRDSSSTFLPQVWEQIPDKIEFLEQLSMKAGLNKDAWKTAEIWFYKVDIEHE